MLIIPIRTECDIERSPLINGVLIALNLICFAIFDPQLGSERMADIKRDHLSYHAHQPALHQYVTYQFMHADAWHLAANMLFLWVFGNGVNGKLGQLPYLVFYLAGGAFAAWVHGVWRGGPSTLLGASGAIAAITTAYLALFPRSQVTVLIWVVVFIHMIRVPAMLLIGLKVIVWDNLLVPLLRGAGAVAYDAHLAGYLFGFVTAMGLLFVRAIPRDQFDMLALWKRWNQRRQFAAAMADPEAAARAQFGAVAKPPPITPEERAEDERKLDESSALRERIAVAVAQQDAKSAAEIYLQLIAVDPAQSLSERAQLLVAREFFGRGEPRQAVAAYERFLASYAHSSEAANVRLLLGIILARDLREFESADRYLSASWESLRDDDRRAQCLRWLTVVRAAMGRAVPGLADPPAAVTGA